MTPVMLAATAIPVAACLTTAVFLTLRSRRARRLRRRLGPEYERLLAEAGSRAAADAEARRRIRARAALQVRPLTADDLEYHLHSWDRLRGEFVTDPAAALMAADRLIIALLHDRGFPADPEARFALLSAGNGPALAGYRAAREVVARIRDRRQPSAAEVAKAMDACGRLFDELLMDAEVPAPRAPRRNRVTAG